MIKALAYKARTYRRFRQDQPVALELLRDMVDAARMTPSSGNCQIQRYVISTDPATNARIFEHVMWAKRIADWNGPAEGERPAAYIVIGCDAAMPQFHGTDTGIAAQTIQLGLAEAGVGCCMIGSFNAKAIHEIAQFPEFIKVTLVIAIGYPGETVIVDEAGPESDLAYYHAADGTAHVPKRKLDDVLLRVFL